MNKHHVEVPAVGLMVAAGLDALFALGFIIISGLGMSMIDSSWVHEGVDREVAEAVMSGGFGIVVGMAGLFIDAVIFLGALKMKQMSSYGFAVAAAILATIPCISSPCFVLGMPFGIWALVVLMRQDVRTAFSDGSKEVAPIQE
jgi:hypothetical protein